MHIDDSKVVCRRSDNICFNEYNVELSQQTTLMHHKWMQKKRLLVVIQKYSCKHKSRQRTQKQNMGVRGLCLDTRDEGSMWVCFKWQVDPTPSSIHSFHDLLLTFFRFDFQLLVFKKLSSIFHDAFCSRVSHLVWVLSSWTLVLHKLENKSVDWVQMISQLPLQSQQTRWIFRVKFFF